MSSENIRADAIDRKARAAIPPQRPRYQDATSRTMNWGEVCIGFDPVTARVEAERCLQCPSRQCVMACPLHNDIPGALALLERGDALGAAGVFAQTSTLSDICGRVCPQERLCEGHCARGKKDAPVQVGRLEAFVADQARVESEPSPVPPATGMSVGIVGAGPAGLVVAELLARRGHRCVVYDAWPEPGGVLLYGIPSFKLAKAIVEAKVERLRGLGVEFVQNLRVGRDRSWESVTAAHDGLFIGTGAGAARRLDIPGEDLPGVYGATDFLVRANVPAELRPPELSEPVKVGDAVVVLGGGDTAMDCSRTARRLGVSHVTCVYRRSEAEMPGRAAERVYAREEGVEFRYLAAPLAFLAGDNGALRAVRCIEMRLTEPDASGRRRPEPVPGSEFEIPCTAAVVAAGYTTDPSLRAAPGAPATDGSGRIIVDPETGETNVPGVFAGGDNVNGADLVVTAAAAGRRAALAIDRYLAARRAGAAAAIDRPGPRAVMPATA